MVVIYTLEIQNISENIGFRYSNFLTKLKERLGRQNNDNIQVDTLQRKNKI